MAAWERVHERLLGEADELADRVVRRLHAELPFYAAVPAAELRPAVLSNVVRCLAALRDRRSATAAELEQAAEVGEVRAHQRVPVEEVLRGFRLAVQEIWDEEVRVGREHGLGDRELLEAAQLTWEWVDAVLGRAAQRHRQVELELVSRDQRQRAHLLRGILHGTIAPGELQLAAQAYGLLPERAYRPFRARPHEGLELHRLERALVATGAPRGGGALVGPLDDDLAGLLPQRPALELPATVGLGPPARLSAMEAAFAEATTALRAADAFALTGVFALDDLGLRVSVFNEDALGEHLLARYLAPLEELGPFGATLRETLRAFFASGMRVDRTAAALFVHPNTLRHRLRRFEEATGADLSCTEELVRVWWALERRTLGERGRR
jgi:hypothetical protein